MTIYCPESGTRLTLMPPVDALDANAVIDYYKDGEHTDRAYAILDTTYNADEPEPHEIVTGLMLHTNSETLHGTESFIYESKTALRITNLYTLEAWIIALGEFAPRVLLYQD